jgi:hypothetical protein
VKKSAEEMKKMAKAGGHGAAKPCYQRNKLSFQLYFCYLKSNISVASENQENQREM